MSTPDISVNIEASDISNVLNSVILFVFLMGMYTVIYFGTIYMYFTKNPSTYHTVPAAITLLYLSSIAMTGIQWYGQKWQFVDNGDTRDSVFLAIFTNPEWINIAISVLTCIVYVIADGLLIWRCFYAWNRSLRTISVSLVLIFAEFALFLVQIAFDAKYIGLFVPAALAARLDALYAAAFLMSFTTTLVTTVLIAYKIYSVSNQQGTSSRRFKSIIDIVVQSGAVYALSQLTAGVAAVLPGTDLVADTLNFAFGQYALLLSFATAGISTTVMVARVSLLSADATYPSTSVHLTGLQFHARSTHPTVNIETVDIVHSVDVDQLSAGEGHAMEAKVE